LGGKSRKGGERESKGVESTKRSTCESNTPFVRNVLSPTESHQKRRERKARTKNSKTMIEGLKVHGRKWGSSGLLYDDDLID